uniref:FBD domain-containing protein n=1 Tax=Fagus sylvatica TaxID=28930 RepID=A0A2N9GYL3_FAGSY
MKVKEMNERAKRAERRERQINARLGNATTLTLTNTNTDDIISTLLDSLLCHILSFLSTQNAVLTSTLSSRWRPLWTLVPTLDLDEFDLVKIDYTDLIFNNVEEINVYIAPYDYVDILNNEPLELPHTLFLHITLLVLKLRGFLLNPPFTCAFPTLNILSLEDVSYANNDSISTLLAACPCLLDLTINVCSRDFMKLDNNGVKFNIIVNTPALNYFYFGGHLGEVVVLENFPNLVESVLHDVEYYNKGIQVYPRRVRNLMGPLYNVTSMKLYMGITEILCSASNDAVPMFHNLFTLKFYGYLRLKPNAWHEVRLLLSRAPNLQILVFQLMLDSNFRCSTTEGYGVEMELVRQILKAATVLKTMTITVKSHLSSEEKLCICKELMKFPRSSRNCQIAFN